MTRILWTPSRTWTSLTGAGPSGSYNPSGGYTTYISKTKITLLFLALILTLHLAFHQYSPSHLHTLGISKSGFSFFPPHSFSHSESGTDSDDPQRPFDTAAAANASSILGPRRANATLLMLCRNSDLFPALQSVRVLQDRFNSDPSHRYPWIFLNEEPFIPEFKERIKDAILGPLGADGRRRGLKAGEDEEELVQFGLIPRDHWFQPDWIDEDVARRGRWNLVFKGIIYADSVSYRNMCRFNSGFFYRHELLQKYKWYWRVEPGVNFYCEMPEDPFVFMEENNKTYSFTISMEEFRETIPSLWPTVKGFVKENPQFLAENNAMEFLSHDNGESYNLCHFWSNFEIASLDFFRSPAYTAYFSTLDSTGNFYYERWGDAPVHSIAASLFLDKNQIHFWNEIGYRHDPFMHCPVGDVNRDRRCTCDPRDNYDYTGASCLKRWQAIFASDSRPKIVSDSETEGEMGEDVS